MTKWALPEAVTISILPMKLSGDRTEHYVRITRGNVTYETNRYIEAHYNRALYERDMLNYVINGGAKPDLMDDQYADLPVSENPQRLS
jgi:hypothetical protein